MNVLHILRTEPDEIVSDLIETISGEQGAMVLDYVINLTKAAYGKGKQVLIFFTGNGVKLTQTPEFSKLAGMAELSICAESFYKFGFRGDVPGVLADGFVNQEKNSELIARSDRCLVF